MIIGTLAGLISCFVLFQGLMGPVVAELSGLLRSSCCWAASGFRTSSTIQKIEALIFPVEEV